MGSASLLGPAFTLPLPLASCSPANGGPVVWIRQLFMPHRWHGASGGSWMLAVTLLFTLTVEGGYPKDALRCYSSMTEPDGMVICPESR